MLQALYKRHTEESVEEVLKSAGFEQPTPLQEQYLSVVLQGRDVLVESASGEGKTVAQLLPIIFSTPSRKKAPYALILVDTAEAIDKFEYEYRRFPGAKLRNKMLVALGKSPNVKKELRPLAKHPAIIVGTTERIIDHIRRNNLSLENVSQVVINVPEHPEHLEFDRDAEYILTKVPSKTQTSLFVPSQERAAELSELLRRPYTLSAYERKSSQPLFHIFTVQRKSADMLLRILFSRGIDSALVVTADRGDQSALKTSMQDNGFRVYDGGVSELSNTGHQTPVRFCAFTTSSQSIQDISAYQAVVFYGVPDSEQPFFELGRLCQSTGHSPFLCVMVAEDRIDSFSNLQEKVAMKTTHDQIPEKEDVLKGKLKSIVKQIKEEEDPELLNKYKKLIKKTVPITMRAYLSAYLFKKALEGESPAPLSGGDKQTIFVSIGKNKKVFPRDLSRLFRKTLDLHPRDIGNIKVLDNYSFVDIPQSQAQRAIELMDGIEFRGRNITVNFARKKEKKGGRDNRDSRGGDSRGGRDNRDNRENRSDRNNRENARS